MAALGLSQLDLYAVNTVHAIDEQDQYKDERDLLSCEPLHMKTGRSAEPSTFMPYCSFAMSGFSEMNVKSLRFIEYGNGTMSNPKMLISNTKSANT